MFLPLADIGIPMITVASGSNFSLNAAVPTRYIIRLSTSKMLAVFAADPKAIQRSKALKIHVGPKKSCPNFFFTFLNSLQLL